MYLAEYQVKEILSERGVPIPDGRLARTPEEAERCAQGIGGSNFAIKAQITAGGRGLSGGVKFSTTPRGVRQAATQMLGAPLVTPQTRPNGEIVEAVCIEVAVEIVHSLYLAIVIDQRTAVPSLLASCEGGVDFEEKAQENLDILKSVALTIDGDLSGIDLDGFFFELGLTGEAAKRVVEATRLLVDIYFDHDATLLEINPLAITADERAIAVDAKMIVDGGALYRHPEFEAMARESKMDENERIAQANEINLVRLDGNIGVISNGAGLGLATNDLLIEKGGKPANFMDIRTTATSFQIAKGVDLLLADPKVKVLLVNVHGGGMTVCDTVAEALNFAYARSARKLPIVYRAAGQNAEWALTIMKDRKLPFEKFHNMSDAAARAVAVAQAR